MAAALKYDQRLKKPEYIVVLIPDTGRNYLTKIFSDSWMQKNGFWEDKEVRVVKVREILNHKKGLPPIISITTGEILSKAVKLMHEYNISQLPVIDNRKVVGSLDEPSLMKLLHDGIEVTKQQISEVMGKPLPMRDEDTDITEAYRVLLSGTTGVIVTRNEIPIGVITRVDLINYWATRNEK